MTAYRIGILPLINNLKRKIPDITHPWYTDNDGALCMLTRIKTSFNLLTRQGPGRGYYPESSMSVLIVHPENLEYRKEFSAHHGFKVFTGACFLRGYIGDDKSKSNWLRERILRWEKNIITIRITAGK